MCSVIFVCLSFCLLIGGPHVTTPGPVQICLFGDPLTPAPDPNFPTTRTCSNVGPPGSVGKRAVFLSIERSSCYLYHCT